MTDSDHPNVMVSSTWADLAEHRKAVFDALLRLGFFPIGMEFDSAKAGKDIIESSLDMVEKAHAYVGIVSHRYGGVPEDKKRNRDNLSITELEYRRALERGIPVYMYLMGEDHPVKARDVEATEKLQELRADAKKRSICAEFSSVEQLKSLVLQSFHELNLDTPKETARAGRDPKLPEPPKLLAIPDFVSGQTFVGRLTELAWLDQWAASADPLIVIEAIGGAGKSALAWEWLNGHARRAVPNLAGAFWYSFYEGGADMSDFAAYALAYINRGPLKEFRGRKTADLARSLVVSLHERPWLLVLDGFERALVAYHRFDASQARDDQVKSEADHRACIKPADADLLLQLVTAEPSRILVTSRLMPAELANKAGLPLKGVQHRDLLGMHPDDALRLMRGLDIRGDESAIRRYLTGHFDNHPLLIGIIAGLVNDYVKDPGNFDRWADDPQGGSSLHLASLKIEQRRTHILAVALNGLEPGVRQLLSRMAAFSDAVAFETIEALSPFQDLPQLVAGLRELERRGLLHWDRRRNSYDLHPVVRGYAFDTLEQTERTEICNSIADHFQSKPPDRYEDAKTLADVQQSINIFQALVQANRLDDAARFYRGNFANALVLSIEANHEILAFLKPFFPEGFHNLPHGLENPDYSAYLLNHAALALCALGRLSQAKQGFAAALRIDLDRGDGSGVCTVLVNFAITCFESSRTAQSAATVELALELAKAMEDDELSAATYWRFVRICRETGHIQNAKTELEAFQRLPAPKDRARYGLGLTEFELCWLKFHQRALTDKLLGQAEALAQSGRERTLIRRLGHLQGEWLLLNGETPDAVSAFERLMEMTQAVGLPSAGVEARLALALARSGNHNRAREICDRLHELPEPPDVSLAEAYLELGDREKARQHVLAGYKWAWADGPPYSRWWELERCRTVLRALGEPEPTLPPYDPTRVEPVPYEADIRALIAKLKQTPPG